MDCELLSILRETDSLGNVTCERSQIEKNTDWIVNIPQDDVIGTFGKDRLLYPFNPTNGNLVPYL